MAHLIARLSGVCVVAAVILTLSACSSSGVASSTRNSAAPANTITADNVATAYRGMQRAASELGLGACAPARSASAANIAIPRFFATARPSGVHVIACDYNQYNGIEFYYTDPPTPPARCLASGTASPAGSSDCAGGAYGANFVITDIEHLDQRGACVALRYLPHRGGVQVIDDNGTHVVC